jgi:hypothetical protein
LRSFVFSNILAESNRRMLQIMRSTALVRTRLLISAAIGLASGVCCWLLLGRLRLGAGDFTWAVRAAQDLLAHRNPYGTYQLYPLTAALFGLPFVGVRPEIAAGIFYGSSSALLAFGLTRDGYRRLLIFLAYPYWAGFLTAQWTPLLMAIAFFPLLLPAALAKPQLGLPMVLTHPSRRGILACVVVVLLSLCVMPRWPLLWLEHIRGYDHFIPMFVFPGPLLALAALRFRERDSHLLTIMSLMPQRWFYDAFILWLIPKTRRELVWTVFFSWVPGIWRWYNVPRSWTQVGRWTVLFLYLPMLGVLMVRWWRETKASRHVLSAN